jgi:uncharacterized membrane protein
MASDMLDAAPVPQRSASKSRRAAALVGESLREVGVLILVFAPLDTIIQGNRLTPRFVVLTLILALVLILVGILMEVGSE